MKLDIVKYLIDWKFIYIVWIVCAWVLTNKPLPNYHDYLFEEYELVWWIIGCIITLITIWHLYKRNWMQATLLFLLFAVPKCLVYIGNTEVVSELIFKDMRYLKQIEYPILVAMIFSLIRAFIHSLISEQDRFSRLYCLVYKERLDYINNLENWIFMVGMIILIPTFTYKLINKEWKDVSWLLLFALLLIPWISYIYCFK